MAVHPKVAASGVAGLVLTVLFGVAATLGVEIPDTLSVALTTIALFITGWAKTGSFSDAVKEAESGESE